MIFVLFAERSPHERFGPTTELENLHPAGPEARIATTVPAASEQDLATTLNESAELISQR
jgi:hypothetical protein